jgi:hypothetical protein
MKAASEISSAEQTAVIILIQTRREGRKTFLTEIMTIASRPGILRGRPLHGVALHGVAVLLRQHGEEVIDRRRFCAKTSRRGERVSNSGSRNLRQHRDQDGRGSRREAQGKKE